MFLSIVIPAYNEEKRIGQTLDKYLEYFKKNEIEIIVVLNGCRDRTLEIVGKYQAKNPNVVKYINIEETVGKGGGVRRGFEEATGDLIGFVDADSSTSPEEYERLINQLGEADGVIASRWKRGAKVGNRTFIRKIISLGFVFLVKVLFWLPYFDTQCGAKIFRKAAIKKIIPRQSVNNMAFDVELLYLMKKNNFYIKEIPTTWFDQSSSAVLGSPLKLLINSVSMLLTLIALRIKYIFN